MEGVGRPECESNIVGFVCQNTHGVACGEINCKETNRKQEGN